jgi:hypothetical protein
MTVSIALTLYTADDTANTTNLDYASGTPRHHHSLYIDDGNIVIQVYNLRIRVFYSSNRLTRPKVENAIFKIHRYFLAKYSPVLRDMLNAPQQDGVMDGTDERPIFLTQDRVAGWELLLDSIYDRSAFSMSVLTN